VQEVDLVNAKYINPFVADSAEKSIVYVWKGISNLCIYNPWGHWENQDL
jgi:hypothetical protein